MPDITQMRTGAFAVYPMYRGLAKLVGMTVAPGGGTHESQLEAVNKRWDDFDFIFYHFKKADAAGEDGDFAPRSRPCRSSISSCPRCGTSAPT